MTQTDVLRRLDVFEGLTDAEYDAVAAIMEEGRYAAGEEIFREGEPGETAYLVLDGTVAITQHVTGNVTRDIATVRAGGVFGEMALVDPGARSATATAADATRLLQLHRREFFDLAAADRAIGIKVFLNLGILLTGRLRDANESHRRAMLWGLETSGAAGLDFYRLLTDQATLEIELVTGSRLSGLLVKVDKTATGPELTLRDMKGGIHVVPYHAIAVVHVDGPARDREGGA